jgi:hypothetical protein
MADRDIRDEHFTVGGRGGGLGHVSVHVGKPIEVTSSELKELWELASIMHRSSIHARRGWLQEYVSAHTKAAKVIRALIDRAQT